MKKYKKKRIQKLLSASFKLPTAGGGRGLNSTPGLSTSAEVNSSQKKRKSIENGLQIVLSQTSKYKTRTM